MRLLASLLATSLSLTAVAAPVVAERFSATFAVRKHGAIVGQTRWSLAADAEDRYRFESVTRASGLLSLFMGGERHETSIWQYHAGSLRPLSYQYRRSGRKGRTVHVRFDWTQGVAYNTSAGHTWKLSLEQGTLDKLLYLLGLILDVRAGKTELTYRVADGGSLKTYRASVLGREDLKTYLGTLGTVKVGSRPTRGTRETTLWLAPSLQYLPVRVEHRDNGELTILTLRSTEGVLTGR